MNSIPTIQTINTYSLPQLSIPFVVDLLLAFTVGRKSINLCCYYICCKSIFFQKKCFPRFSTLVPTINLGVSKFMRLMPSVISLPQLHPQVKVPKKSACYTSGGVLGRVESRLFSFCNIFCEMVVWWTVILIEALIEQACHFLSIMSIHFKHWSVGASY